MKVADLPNPVIEELITSEYWRIDIDPGLDAKHEFFMSWKYLLPHAKALERKVENLAELIDFHGYNVLLPIERDHHSHLHLLPRTAECPHHSVAW